MPLPSFFQRFRSGAQTPAPQVQPLSPADIEQARVRARRRMIGMAVLVGAGVIGFPWLFETQPRPLATDIQVVNAAAPGAPATTPPTRLASGKVTQAAAEPVVPPQVSRALDAERSAQVAARSEAAAAAREEIVEAPEPKPEPKPAPKPEVRKPEPKPEPKKPEAAKPAQTAAVAKPADKKPATPAKPEAKPETKPAAKDSKEDADTRYIVQVGAFGDNTTAHAARMKVERLGIKTYTQAVDTPSGKKIRVRVGPYTNKADADKAIAALRKAGLAGQLLTL
ncbi:MAG: SPOR domain-containing protein [Aquabacterium sp.]|jgi:DedD protein|uniref:SPOR domain-containing protein n=1 Tax=Aquabacterium sp. TaxID=1872578 RepID=UPI003BB13A31